MPERGGRVFTLTPIASPPYSLVLLSASVDSAAEHHQLIPVTDTLRNTLRSNCRHSLPGTARTRHMPRRRWSSRSNFCQLTFAVPRILLPPAAVRIRTIIGAKRFSMTFSRLKMPPFPSPPQPSVMLPHALRGDWRQRATTVRQGQAIGAAKDYSMEYRHC